MLRLRPYHRAMEMAGVRRRVFGVESQTYDELVALQGGRCAICNRPETAMRRGIVKTLSVDHDHATGRIRGLLCHQCNTAIGLMGDSPERLTSAIRYLTNPQLRDPEQEPEPK